MRSFYIETTVIGDIAGRLHRNAMILARQKVSREFWHSAQDRFRFLVSSLVVAECAAGDAEVSRERLDLLNNLDLVQIDHESEKLAAKLTKNHAVPATEPRDALHIALAAVNGIDYLATWNFKHIMNPETQHLIDAVCRDAGFEPATICTPHQLMEASHDA